MRPPPAITSGDAALRDLERAVAASPDDGPARLALARGLVRAGRRDSALRALDLRRVPAALLADASALAAELWPEALARLEPAWSTELPAAPLIGQKGVVFSGDGRTLIVPSAWGPDAVVTVIDATTGDVLHAEPGVHAVRAFATPTGALLEDHAAARLLGLSRDAERVRVAACASPGGSSLVDAAPSGDRALLFSAGVVSVHAWEERPRSRRAELRALASVRGSSPAIDWARDLVITSDPVASGLTVTPVAGGEPWTLALPVPWVSTRGLIAPGVLCCAGNGLRLVHLERRWQLPLLRAQRRGPLRVPSLASDRRGLRLVLGARAVRLDVDLEEGRLLAAPPDLERLGRQDEGDELIHPHADVHAAYTRRPEPHVELRPFAGPRLLVLPPGATPRAWSPDGRALAITLGERRLSLWTVPPGA